MEWKVHNERLSHTRLHEKPAAISVISAYAPTENSDDEDKDIFYKILTDCITSIPKKKFLFVGGEMNAKLGESPSEEAKSIGKLRTGEGNEHGDTCTVFGLD